MIRMDTLAPKLSYEFAQQHQILATNDKLILGPNASFTGILEYQRRSGRSELEPVWVDEDAFNQHLHSLYQYNLASTEQVVQELDMQEMQSLVSEVNQLPIDLLEHDGEVLVIRIINALIAEAIREGASDVHIQPTPQQVTVRMRCDGSLRTLAQLDPKLGPLMLSRIKVMSRLNIADRLLPQDGRMSVHLAGKEVDIRVAIVPSQGAERVVLRILDRHHRLLNLADLGMPKNLQQEVISLIHRPHGILLVTGPTGSGKTTTLYACLQNLDRQAQNIMTIEDPVEYELSDISQTAVNPLMGLTFAKGLRALLRQDPDVILVGEIRDLETAQIAIQASLTGHLVLSTMHTNSAVNAITRLQDMGVPSYLIASSLIGVIGQRLLPKVCPTCRTDKGCAKCGGTGYQGRIGIFEWMQINAQLKHMIHDQDSELSLQEACPDMFGSMLVDGQAKLKQGLIKESDLMRVCQSE